MVPDIQVQGSLSPTTVQLWGPAGSLSQGQGSKKVREAIRKQGGSPEPHPGGRERGLGLKRRPCRPLQAGAPKTCLLLGRVCRRGSARCSGRPGATSPPDSLRGGSGRGPAPWAVHKGAGWVARRFGARFQVTLQGPRCLRRIVHAWVVAGLELQPCCSGTRSPSTTTSTTLAATCGKGCAATQQWGSSRGRASGSAGKALWDVGVVGGAARSGCSAPPSASRFSTIGSLRTERASRVSPRDGRTDGRTLAGPDALCWGLGLQSLVRGTASPVRTPGGCGARNCGLQLPQVRPGPCLLPAGRRKIVCSGKSPALCPCLPGPSPSLAPFQ